MEQPIQFGTDGWRATTRLFTTDRVLTVGRAVASYLENLDHSSKEITIGYDARARSPEFATQLAELFVERGFDVHLPDRDLPTPITAFTVVDRSLDGAIMITASHNPPEYNGLKYLPADGAPALPTVTAAIESRLNESTPQEEGDRGDIYTTDQLTSYFSHIHQLIPHENFEGLRIGYDAIHGSGRGITDEILEEAGASVARIRCNRDHRFGGSAPEPSRDNLTALIELAERGDVEIGVANDGDADRLAIVTRKRGYLDESLLFAILYEYLLDLGKSGPAIRTVSTSRIIDRLAESRGQEVIETPVGFKWVAAAMAEHDALIGGEESGGFSIRGHIREKDGVMASLLTTAAHVAKPLDDRADRILDKFGPIYQNKRSISCADERKELVLERLQLNVPEEIIGRSIERTTDIDGIKLDIHGGAWVLIRPSGTEPKIRIYAEASSSDQVTELLDAGERLIQTVR